MIEIYRSEVLGFYEKKKALGELSTNLMKPTCANLRNEFRLLYNAGCDNLDKRVVREFLQMPFDKELTDLAVKKCDIDKFKSLGNFINRNLKTHERNFELLAWLINFPQRPYSKYWRITNGKPDLLSELSITNKGIVEESLETNFHFREHTLVAHNAKVNSEHAKQDYWVETENLQLENYKSIPTDGFAKKEVTLEYPSGVKLSVDASDISLIEKLVKLW
ncbi:hypothetical protein [Pedobacter sp. Hv1]|uniref:hypothetical protein n=1 Tax=Pedobacter sp. Hv1 TaxID=1740090 RepID=UPI0006D8D059|nr:hypothetical protein [Pedobacter sp. Hv1]KQB99893.1 hypothetical protein AQF98_15375 [Pedobacter sp. Hv1]